MSSQNQLLAASIREKAEDLKRRLQLGEKIPLKELELFLNSAGKVIQNERKKTDTKPLDVNFF